MALASIVPFTAAALYGVNMGVGIAAWRSGRRFGALHHVLYGAVFVSAAWAAWVAFHPALVVVLAVLAVLPAFSARSRWHPALACVGLGSWAVALVLR